MSTTTTLDAPATTVATPDHFAKMSDALEPLLVQRRAEIGLMHLALVARCHVFFLSAPGTAKSMLAKQYMARISDATLFACLLNQFADDSLLFGPLSLEGFKKGRRTREFHGYLPTANVFFADEIWKSSTALANSMLQATNERLFFDDGVEKAIPLWTMVSASNELPDAEHDGLAAMWDRIPLRRYVAETTDPGDMLALLNVERPDPNPAPVFGWDVVVDAHRQAMALPLNDEVKPTLVNLLVAARSLVGTVSGRRMIQALEIAKANAWLSGADEVVPEHLDFLVDFLWNSPDQRPELSKIVLGAVAPLRADITQLSDDVAGIISQLHQVAAMDAEDPAKLQGSLELNRKLQRAANDAFGLEQKATGRALDDVDETWRHIKSAHARVQTELMDLDANQVSDIQGKARQGQFTNI